MRAGIGARSPLGTAVLPTVVGDILEAMPVALVVVDAARRIVLANREVERLLGYEREALLGQPVEMLVPEPARDAHVAHQRAYLESPVSRPMAHNRDLMARHRDGRLVPVEIGLKPIEGPDGPLVIATILDLSARKALEEHALGVQAELERRVRERTDALERSNRQHQHMVERLEQSRLELERASRQDALTGLANRRELEHRLALEQRRCDRHGSPIGVAMLDLDHFKRVNDAFGHALGDEVLRRIGRILASHCRAIDFVSRYGGEEFVLVLPDTDPPEAFAVCERIRRAVEHHPWSELHPGLRVTISIGLVSRRPGEDANAAIDRADKFLYAAKHFGRNRVEAEAAE